MILKLMLQVIFGLQLMVVWQNLMEQVGQLLQHPIHLIAHNQVYAIAIENSTTMWIGTAGGLCKFDGTTNWTTYSTANSSLPYDYVNTIAIDAAGDKWIGTTQGAMAQFDGTSTWTFYNTGNSSIPGVDVRNIMIDADDNKWISTNDGGFAFYGIIPTVGIKNNLVAADVNLYPNPANEAITIDLGDVELSNEAQFKVIDVLGKEVKSLNLNSKANGVSKTSLDLKDLEKGVYFYSIITNNKILKTGKFIKN
jgi:hypothetical protein